MAENLRLEGRQHHLSIKSNALKSEVIMTETAGDARDEETNGFVHFAFTVDALEPWYERVVEKSLEITFGPELLPELKINTFLFKDPFGAVWEIMEETDEL